MKIGEFFIDLFVDATKGELTIGNLVKSMGELEVASVGEIAILVALAEKIEDLSKAAMASALGFENFTASTGASADELQRWQAAASVVGISGQTVAASLGAISKGLVGMQKYGESAPIMNLLHPLQMSLSKYRFSKPEELLQGIRDSPVFQAMEAANKQFVLDKAGLGGMLRVLTKGEGGVSDTEFKQFIKEAGTMSKSDIKKWEAMRKELVEIENVATRIGRTVAGWFSGPMFNILHKELESLRVIADFLESKKTIKSAVDAATEMVGPAAEMTGDALVKYKGPGLALSIIDYIEKNFPNTKSLGIAPVPQMVPAMASGGGRVVNVNHQSTLNVNGTKLDEKSLKKVFDDHSAEQRRLISSDFGTPVH